MKKFIVTTLIIAFLISCSSKLYTPIQSTATISLAELQKGRNLYITNCASCHQLYEPNKYNATEWVTIVDEMQPKAKITDEQKKLIYDYLINSPK